MVQIIARRLGEAGLIFDIFSFTTNSLRANKKRITSILSSTAQRPPRHALSPLPLIELNEVFGKYFDIGGCEWKSALCMQQRLALINPLTTSSLPAFRCFVYRKKCQIYQMITDYSTPHSIRRL
jgi:hypothetical protein